MEMIHLFNWMRGSFTNLINIRTDVLDAEILLNRIQRYLCLREVEYKDIIDNKKLK